MEIYDDLVPLTLSKQIKRAIFNENKIQNIPHYFTSDLTGVSNNTSFKDYGFSNALLNYRDSLVFNGGGMLLSPLFILALSKNYFINSIFLARSFIQLPTPNPFVQSIHTDISQPHNVCLYYVNDSDGDTIFFDDNENEIKRISPKEGRIVVFNGSIKHCGSKPTKFPRATINICFDSINV